MTEQDYDQKVTELDRILNDPDSRMEPSRVWSLLAEISSYEHREPAIPAAE